MLNEHETSSALIISIVVYEIETYRVSIRFGSRKKEMSNAIDEESYSDDRRRLKVASVRVRAYRQESFAVYNRDSR